MADIIEEEVLVTATPLPKPISGTENPLEGTKPRFLIEINDKLWPSGAYVTLDISGFYANATFAFDFTYSKVANLDAENKPDPNSLLIQLLKTNASLKRNRVKLYVGYVSKDMPEDDVPTTQQLGEAVFIGVVDKVMVDIGDDSVSITGRDLTAIFQESYTHAQFRNTTTVGALKELLAEYDIKAVIKGEGSPLGSVYSNERIDFENLPSNGYNNWDLITKFARYDGYKAFFKGETFYYVPYEDMDEVIRFTLFDNIDDLKMERNFSIASSRTSVEIASTRLKEKDSTLAKIGPGSGSGTKGDRVEYRFVLPNLSQEEAGLIAESAALALAQMEKLITIESTGAKQQNVQNGLILEGTGLDFDEPVYRIIHVNWTMGKQVGWQAEITAISLPDQGRLETHRVRQRNSLLRT